ncbi:MAG: NTP transferase domain-containing protein [Oscillospiraceae bacterium]|nr:NTP transferase domain-containing protein [Oscillospiraceae bacterium]
MNKPTLVVLAAGMGSRFGGLKQMTPVDDHGNSILHYSIYDACQAGFGKVVFVIKHAIEADFKKITAGLEKHIDVAYVYQETDMLPDGFTVPEGRVKPWGTGHAVLCAKDEIDGPFTVINSDDFYGRGTYLAIADFLRQKRAENEHAMVGYLLRNALTEHGSVARGVCETRDGLLTKVTERTKIYKRGDDAAFTEDEEHFVPLSGDTLVSMNFWGYQPSMLQELERLFPLFLRENLPVNPIKCEFYLPFATDELIRSGRAVVHMLTTDETWYGVTYREDLGSVQAAIAAMHESGLYPDVLFD